MNTTHQTAVIEGDKHMNVNRQTAIKESEMKITASKLIRWAGLSALLAGVFFVLVGMFHPLSIISSVTTTRWIIVHVVAIAMSFFGLFGMAGIYARQAEKSGWLGLVGFVMFSLWLMLMIGFTFVEAFILPSLATSAPTFVEGFLGMFSDSASQINLGVLPILWTVTGPLLILGGLLFGIATFRAGILPRWAGALIAIGSMLTPLAALLPPEHEAKILVPTGLAFVWMGYALWSARREQSSESVRSPQLGQIGAD